MELVRHFARVHMTLLGPGARKEAEHVDEPR